jgi:hypothetical protein
MEAPMADQATSAAGRSSIGPHPETPAAGAPASAPAPADQATAASAGQPTTTAAQQAASEQEAAEQQSNGGFGARGRMRRRLRFLRKARELAYRDLGGLVFEMQRLGERRDELVAAKLATLSAIDTELRALEDALAERRPLTILRESGIAACPRCAAIHGSEDRFCPSCGLAMESRADRPIAAPMPPPPSPPPSPTTMPPAPAAAPTAVASAPATAVRPALTPPVPPRPPQPTPPTPTPTPVTDERPTEIIRPTDERPGEGT